jgi:hypothetical protein
MMFMACNLFANQGRLEEAYLVRDIERMRNEVESLREELDSTAAGHAEYGGKACSGRMCEHLLVPNTFARYYKRSIQHFLKAPSTFTLRSYSILQYLFSPGPWHISRTPL